MFTRAFALIAVSSLFSCSLENFGSGCSPSGENGTSSGFERDGGLSCDAGTVLVPDAGGVDGTDSGLEARAPIPELPYDGHCAGPQDNGGVVALAYVEPGRVVVPRERSVHDVVVEDVHVFETPGNWNWFVSGRAHVGTPEQTTLSFEIRKPRYVNLSPNERYQLDTWESYTECDDARGEPMPLIINELRLGGRPLISSVMATTTFQNGTVAVPPGALMGFTPTWEAFDCEPSRGAIEHGATIVMHLPDGTKVRGEPRGGPTVFSWDGVDYSFYVSQASSPASSSAGEAKRCGSAVFVVARADFYLPVRPK